MTLERRDGLIELAEKVGRLTGSHDEIKQKLDQVHQSHLQVADTVQRLERAMQAVPFEEHMEDHAFVRARIAEAKDSAAFWREMRFAAGRAVASKAGIAFILLTIAGFLMMAGAKDTAVTLFHKAIAALGG